MLIHDIIKIKYVRLGYILKNYPYHLISDEEMFNAFIQLDPEYKNSLIDDKVRFFDDYYPNPFDPDDVYTKIVINEETGEREEVVVANLYNEYERLKQYIVGTIVDYLKYCDTPEAADHQLPPWIYSYMLGEVVYQQSDYLDIQDTLDLLNCSNLDNQFTKEACKACYIVSLGYVSKLSVDTRPPTVFGEPHIIKQLRMAT